MRRSEKSLKAGAIVSPLLLAFTLNGCTLLKPKSDNKGAHHEEAADTSHPLRTSDPTAILLDKQGYRIHGEYKLLRGGTIQWFRLPEEVWEDRLQKFKAAGFNTVDMYVAWSEHEPQEGKFDFETKNIRKFLDLCAKYGLYVYVRPGPYICNELNGGGVPSWLLTRTTKRTIADDGLVNMRTQDKEWLEASRKYLQKLNQVLAPYQITKGGPIILYAIENEYDHFPLLFLQEKVSISMLGGTERDPLSKLESAPYFTALRDMVRQSGIDVPITTAPGGGAVAATGDVADVVPMPNVYNFSEPKPLAIEKTVSDILADMHDPKHHNAQYINYPSGITETSRISSWMKRAFFGGMDAFFSFNIVALNQDGYRNAMVPASSDFFDFDPERFVQAFVSPTVYFLQGVLDYYGAIGPSGTLREKFFSFRRANLFFDAFESLIAPIENPKRSNMTVTGPLLDRRVIVDNPELGSLENGSKTTWWMEGANGTYFISLLNESMHDVTVEKGQFMIDGESLPRFAKFTVPVEEFPGLKRFSSEKLGFNGSTLSEQVNASLLVAKLPLTQTTKLKYSTSEVLTVKDFNNEKLVVLFGKAGTTGELAIEGKNLTVNTLPTNVAIREQTPTLLTMTYTHTPGNVLELTAADGKKIKVLLTSRHEAGRIWFAKKGSEDILFAGPDLVVQRSNEDFDLHLAPGGLKIFTLTSSPIALSGFDQATAFDKVTGLSWFQHPVIPHPAPRKTALMQGRIAMDTEEKELNPPTEGWLTWKGEPRAVEPMGFTAGHAWYRADVNIPSTANLDKAELFIESASDIVGIYVNGTYAGTVVPLGTEIDSGSLSESYRLPNLSKLVRPGRNTLAFNVEVWGHGSFMFPKGRIPASAAKIPALGFDAQKGLIGTAKLAGIPITSWQFVSGLGGERRGWAQPQFDDSSWKPSSGSLTLPKGGIVWYRTTLRKTDLLDPNKWATPLGVSIKGKTAKATLFLNGKVIGRWLSDNDWLGQGSWTRGVRNGWTGANDLDAFPLEKEVLKDENVIAIAFEDTSSAEAPAGKIDTITLELNHEELDGTNDAQGLVPVISEFAQVHVSSL